MSKKIESANNSSPLKAAPLLAIGAGISALTGIGSFFSARSAQRDAEAREEAAREEMNRLRGVYENLDTSNPFAGMQNQFANIQNPYAGLENTMEDLTVNQQQAEFERDQFQQSQANIMSNLRESAGGSGIAALAQQLAQSGQIAAQRSSASIGQQEAQNQRAAAATAGRLQEMQARGAENLALRSAQGQANVDQLIAQGEQQSQQMEMGKQATLLGMSQQETAAYMQQAQQAQQAKWDSISNTMGNIASFAGPQGNFGIT